jgi:hypothetical protein
MTCIPIKDGILCVAETYKPGDLPPTDENDYIGWCEWAEVQHRAGIKWTPCGVCGRHVTPQEQSGETAQTMAKDRKGNPVTITAPICAKCMEREP